jgi:hypothetical protein
MIVLGGFLMIVFVIGFLMLAFFGEFEAGRLKRNEKDDTAERDRPNDQRTSRSHRRAL